MPRMAPADLDDFLQQPHIAVLATLRGDGRPYTVPVWFLHRAGSFWLTGTYGRVWCRQLLADPRASLCIEATAPVAGHVGVDGSAVAREPDRFDIWPITEAMVDRYLPVYMPGTSRDDFLATMRSEHRLLFELVPDVFRAIDMRVYRGKRADREYQARQGR